VNSLKRIAIAATLFPLLSVATHAEDRSIDGTGNYLSIPSRGAANTPMIRFGYTSQFKDSTGAMLTDADRANARDISNAIFAQSESRLSARNLSDFAWAWGQFVSHDTDLTTTSNGAAVNGSEPIAVNGPTDPLGPNAIPFVRTNYMNVSQPRGGGTRLPVNEVTTYIDASTVYGSDAIRAAALRTGGGAGAKLLTSANNLLPYNTADLPVENNGPLPNTQLFLAGDIRANENSLLTSLHTVFTREHNRLVDIIAAQQPSLTEEQQYQLARKIVSAEVQAITYKEFLPALLGTGASVPKAEQYSYNGVTAEITTAYAQAGFRYGHSTVSSQLQLVDDSGANTGSLAVRNAFYNPTIIGDDPIKVDQLLKGAATQVSEEVDTLVVDELRSFLFGPPGAGGLDLAALNIQRGRDVGLPHYRSMRIVRQLPSIQSFSDITSDPELAAALSSIYGGNLNNIDAWVGMLAEDHADGASVGLLLKREIEDQFRRLRDGDRLFYRGNAAGLYTDGVLNAEIAAIIDLDNWRLSDLLAANTSVTSFQENVFFVPGTGDFNGDGSVDAADYNVWRDSLGHTGEGLAADADHNGQIDVQDYNLWKQVFGSVYAGGNGSSLAAVPEPGSALLLLIAATALATCRRGVFR